MDDIYPKWLNNPTSTRTQEEIFVAAQKTTRNDVEHAFRVLQQCFAIICRPT